MQKTLFLILKDNEIPITKTPTILKLKEIEILLLTIHVWQPEFGEVLKLRIYGEFTQVLIMKLLQFLLI